MFQRVLAAGDSGLRGDVGEGAIAIVAVEDVLAVIGDEEIVAAVVVVVADADALSPAGVTEAGFGGDVGEGSVAIVFEEMEIGSCPAGKPSRREPLTRKMSSQSSWS